MKQYYLILLGLFISSHAYTQPQSPFEKGINLTGWFQTSSVGEIQFGKYEYGDFKDIKSLGVDVIRLPINLHFMTDGEPNYTIEPLFFQFLDTVVNRCEKLDMHLIFDNHTFDPSIDTEPEVEDILKKVWSQMAIHYENRGSFIYYEILNEPHGIDDNVWNTIQEEVMDEIGLYDTKHTIVVGPANWNSFNHLSKMPHYDDDNLIYTFHFYDPFLLTHQGAGWIEPSMNEVVNIPFPYMEESMPTMPGIYSNTWIEDSYNGYSSTGTKQEVERLINIAVDFSKERNVPVFCGEFGVLMDNCDNQERINWYKVVADCFAEHKIAWTMWDYHGSFGAFEKEGAGMFDYDLNTTLLDVIGLNVPKQTEYVQKPDSVGFLLYHDFVDNMLFTSSWGISSVNYYNHNQVNNGQFCLEAMEIPQYKNIAFDFRLDKDLTQLKANDYAVDLMIRCNRPNQPIDIRFIDTYIQDGEDIPWRMQFRLNSKHFKGDLAWHHVHITLSEFIDFGGHDGEWHESIGAFDWAAVDRFDIVAETDVSDATFWFDNIHITNKDTALIRNTTIIDDPYPEASTDVKQSVSGKMKIYPNPTKGHLCVEFPSIESGEIFIFDMQGKVMLTFEIQAEKRLEIDLSDFISGIYLLEVKGEYASYIERINLIP